MSDIIDIHDLSNEQINLVQEFVDFLKRKQKSKQLTLEEGEKEKEWAKLAVTSFAEDWENDKDAAYDNWREHYHV